MNRIDVCFRRLQKQSRKGFISYITAGDGGLSTTRKLLSDFTGAGVDIVELGVPFSDPLADGVVNQKAAERALAHGTTLSKILALVKNFRRQSRPLRASATSAESQLPIVLFTYFNPIHRYGVKRFVRDAVAAGVDGVLVLDLPPEEAVAYQALLSRSALKTIYLIAPTTPPQRIAQIARRATGFIYYVSREGVTGMQRALSNSIASRVKKIRSYTKVPVAVGFGISTPAQARQVAQIADAVVVGSAIVARMARPVPRWGRCAGTRLLPTNTTSLNGTAPSTGGITPTSRSS